MVALPPSPPSGAASEAAFWKRIAVVSSAAAVLLLVWGSASGKTAGASARPRAARYFSPDDTGYKSAGLVPMWAFHQKPSDWTTCTFKAPFDGKTKVPKKAFDRVPLTRYTAYYNLADWLLNNPDKATGHGLEISGASFLQQFFVDATWDRRNYPEVDVMALHRAVKAESYDWIILDQVLEHVALPFLAVAEIHRALKPGGRLLLAVPGFNPYHAGPQDYWRMSHDALRVLLSIFSEVEVCGAYRSVDYIRNYLDRSEKLGAPAYATLSGVPNQDEDAFRIAKGDPEELLPSGEMAVNGTSFIIHSWAIARK